MTVADEVLALAEAAITPAPVFDAHVPSEPPTRYAVLYPDPGEREFYDVGHTSDCFTHRWQITSVGATRPEAEWIAAKIRDAFVDVRPEVEGLDCAPIEHEASQPIRPDDRVAGRVVMYATDQYAMEATAAS